MLLLKFVPLRIANRFTSLKNTSWTFAWPPPLATLYISLLGMDALLILSSALRSFLTDYPYEFISYATSMWLLETDRGIPEIFGYVKALACAGALYGYIQDDHKLACRGWSLAFLWVFLDDALQLHEVFGRLLLATTTLPPIFSVHAYLYSESVLWLLVGAPLVLGLIYAYVAEPSTRRLSRRLALLFGLLLLFAGIADGLHAFIDTSSASEFFKSFMTLHEDGGELVVLIHLLTNLVGYNHPQKTQTQ